MGQAATRATRATSTALEQISRELIISVYLAVPAGEDVQTAMRLSAARTIRLNVGAVKP